MHNYNHCNHYGLGRLNQLKAEFDALDIASIRPLRALASGTFTAGHLVGLKEIETKADQIHKM